MLNQTNALGNITNSYYYAYITYNNYSSSCTCNFTESLLLHQINKHDILTKTGQPCKLQIEWMITQIQVCHQLFCCFRES